MKQMRLTQNENFDSLNKAQLLAQSTIRKKEIKSGRYPKVLLEREEAIFQKRQDNLNLDLQARKMFPRVLQREKIFYQRREIIDSTFLGKLKIKLEATCLSCSFLEEKIGKNQIKKELVKKLPDDPLEKNYQKFLEKINGEKIKEASDLLLEIINLTIDEIIYKVDLPPLPPED